LHGTLVVQSVKGAGTCVTVRVPLPAATAAVAALPTDLSTAPSLPAGGPA
jgi:two-component system sensor histidine kinase DesK